MVSLTSSNQTLKLNPDQPSEIDYLDFKEYASAFYKIISDPNARTPLTIGIFGKWGSGKTTLMRNIEKEIKKSPIEGGKKKNITVWFNAWKYEKSESLWRALLLRVLHKIQNMVENNAEDTKLLKDLEDSLYQPVQRVDIGDLEIDWRGLLKGGVETAAKIVISLTPGLNIVDKVTEELQKSAGVKGVENILESINRKKTEIRHAQLSSFEQFEENFSVLVKKYIQPGRLVVFVDDLDRCLPTKSIEILESIKLFLDVPDCFFILAIDPSTIEQGIRSKYKDHAAEIEEKNYLEKIIQIPFNLPPLEHDQVKKYIEELTPGLSRECKEIFEYGYNASEPNPRQIKRTINAYIFLSALAQERRKLREMALNQVLIAKLVTIQHNFVDLYKDLRIKPDLLVKLEKYYQDQDQDQDQINKAKELLPPPLHPYANEKKLESILNSQKYYSFNTLKDEDLKAYFSLTKSIPNTPDTKSAALEFPEITTVSVKGGKYLIGLSNEKYEYLKNSMAQKKEVYDQNQFNKETKELEIELSSYYIGKYPITNKEYEYFVKTKKSPPPFHWRGTTCPDSILYHPVTGVSFDDCEKYCNWLEEVTGTPYRLPTEAQWEVAARGKSGNIFPWGDDFDTKKCNTIEANEGGTVEVYKYENEDNSEFGVSLMSGNVFEWCRDWYEEDYYNLLYSKQKDPCITGRNNKTHRAVRGGSWDQSWLAALCTRRGGKPPHSRTNNIGFRVVVELS